ncbi:iron chelate uptake ABC transporter family permease subunit [Paenibacillus macerans]|uniref:ABC 3 transport family protein n=4 Tax=Paenibacillus macerans TaxID=44252 RepID=A0A090YQW6_PAEMA|nr:iron ABC transporter permease [Paenibacillus macerans]KFN00830.1 ABC 3 transport family protein [Paenibacillus macerans]MBS5912337.1 iron ABC transporter permease [Paenibacillus macerans]MCY7556701.1 iron ABC transporter permease [Paenibacillus macerans]MUG24396.1 iron chelate uptake ABC transporter family permease subunit [Paenibacillus macerans]UMV50252.1 iron ABC transporter permease [Paenibacillus macerans]
MNKGNYPLHLQQRSRRAYIVMIIFALLIVGVFIFSMNTGYFRLSPVDVFKTLFGMGTDKQELALFQFRLPRIVNSVLIGMGMAVAGCIFQGISRNPLADPGVLGINAGAGLAVTLFISFYPTTSDAPVFLMPLLAFLGSALAAALIYVLSFKKNYGLLPIRMVLVGIAVAAGINAAMIVLQLRLRPENFQNLQIWLVGNIWGTSWKFVLALIPWIVVLIPYVFTKARALNVMNLGDQTATGLGAPLERSRFGLLAAAVGLTGSCVAVGGGISFVGLIAPHLARRLVGPKHEYLLPASALAGGLLVIVGDTLGRWVFQPHEIPTGIVVAVIGAPYFLYLLSKSRV